MVVVVVVGGREEEGREGAERGGWSREGGKSLEAVVTQEEGIPAAPALNSQPVASW